MRQTRVKSIVRHGLLAILAVCLVVLVDRPASAGDATEDLRTRMEEVLRVLVDPGLKGAAKANDRRVAVFTMAQEIFDFHETARLALGKHWEHLSPAERAEFAQLFMGLIEHSYITNIEMYDGEKVLYTGEAVEGDHAVVRSKIVGKQGDETPIEYRMIRKADDHWRVYDVKVEGMSLVANYRAQFNKVINGSSYGDLVRRLKEKQGPVPTTEPVSASPKS